MCLRITGRQSKWPWALVYYTKCKSRAHTSFPNLLQSTDALEDENQSKNNKRKVNAVAEESTVGGSLVEQSAQESLEK